MTIELIPVIKIGYNNQDVMAPDKYPYWDNSEIWDKYHEECYQKAGFRDKLVPYLKGSSFYKLTDISDTCTFFGGYVLRVNGQDKYFPQCCGEMSDIKYWENISNDKSSYHEEHPSPQLKFENNKIVFDFSTNEFDEPFQPTPTETTFSINRLVLKNAVEKVKTELQVFEYRLNKINEDEELNIDNIGGLLIWDNRNYE